MLHSGHYNSGLRIRGIIMQLVVLGEAFASGTTTVMWAIKCEMVAVHSPGSDMPQYMY